MSIKSLIYGFSLWLLVVLIAACEHSHPQVEAVLQQADALMDAHPDSAFSLLDSLHYRQPMSRQETARYALLLAKATNKTYHPLLPCDSLLDISLSYYKKSTPERATALLYKGRLEEELGQTGRAIELLQSSLSIIRDYPNEKEIKRHLLSSLGILYEDNKHFEESLSAFRKMLSVCDADKDKAIAFRGISKYYVMTDQTDSAFYYIKEALQCSKNANDSILIPQMEHNLALYYYYYSLPDSALLMEREAINHAVNDTKRRLYYGTYGAILYDLNQIDSAVYYLNASIDTTLFERHRLTTLLNLYQIEKYRGNLAEASQYLEEHVSILDSLYTEERDTEISNLIHEHKTELKVQEEKERGRRMQQLILLSASFLFLYILSAFMRYVHKKKKEKLQIDVKLHENEKQIALLQSLVSSHEEIIAQLEEKKKTLEKAHEEIIAKNEEQEHELFSNIHSLQEQIAAFHAQIEAAHKQIRLLENWQFTQTAIYQRVLELRKQASKEIPKSLNASEKNKLKTIIFSLNRKEVETIQLEYPSWTEDDILLKLLEDRTDFDAKTIAICFGIYSTHALNQRRYRMYRK
ncbi:MAG: hypothetical protein IJR56_00970 [Bacteroidaceae bacterium]|nr:hypothetical protein [Bacteroidaceae bacterium]MBQ9882835.1 hypothetical protein [Bacteroidaceae bacterium]